MQQILLYGGFAMAALMFILLVVLFFAYRIPEVIRYFRQSSTRGMERYRKEMKKKQHEKREAIQAAAMKSAYIQDYSSDMTVVMQEDETDEATRLLQETVMSSSDMQTYSGDMTMMMQEDDMDEATRLLHEYESRRSIARTDLAPAKNISEK